LLWLPEDQLGKREWLQSELASHISLFGVWILGKGDWRRDVTLTESAVTKKIVGISRHVETVNRHWEQFAPPYQEKHHRLIRRNLQRLWLLGAGRAVPPTRLLDDAWKRQPDKRERWLELSRFPLIPHSVRTLLIPLAR
jgi:hypothetical protein